MAEKITVALIGGGRTGTPLLKELIKYSYVTVIGVADKDPKAPSVTLAKKHKIYTTTQPMDLVKKVAEIDILIEVSGDSRLKKNIKATLAKTKNTRTIIMHDLIARLFISVCTGRKTLLSSFHPQDVGIGK
ncbi:MAG: hypothetical protein EPN25_08280 [Nitrospirae bacterium]|nr:MAG: hypothetical protein EPN25_08280 [Nitrospirota bacterium]